MGNGTLNMDDDLTENGINLVDNGKMQCLVKWNGIFPKKYYT